MAVGHGVVSVDSAVVGGCDIVGDGECGSGIGGCRGRGSRRRRDGSDSGGGRGSDSDGRRGFRSVGGRGCGSDSFRPHRHGGRRRRGRRAKDAFFIVAAASRHVATQPIGTNPRRTRRARPAIPRGVELRGSAPEIAPLRVGIVGIQGRRPVVSFFYSFYFSVGTRSRQRVQNGRPILFFFFFLFFLFFRCRFSAIDGGPISFFCRGAVLPNGGGGSRRPHRNGSHGHRRRRR
mmetsp:Transcript_32876/g.63078  ORF Transcript_32876/g.63078 Transcript_32876/m.63078 type:complete len:233 (-) Transcript_32876:20-718(-)